MYKEFQIDNLSPAIFDIILPKFEQYIINKRNDKSTKEKIDNEVNNIENIEDLIYEMTNNKDFSNFKSYNSMTIDGYYFNYDKSINEFKIGGNILEMATNRVFYKEGLTDNWNARDMIRSRIRSILVTLQETSFDETLAIISKQINFDEFIELSKDPRDEEQDKVTPIAMKGKSY